MAIVFFIPGALRELAGRSEVRVDGSAGTLANALALLWAECPAIRDRVITELGQVRPHINVFVDGENMRYTGGLESPVRDGAEVFLLPAVSGGSEGCEGGRRIRRRTKETKAGVIVAAIAMLWASTAAAQRSTVPETIAIATPDGGSVAADLYGDGRRGVVIVGHGGYSLRETWAAPARAIAVAGFRVLVFDTRAATALRVGRETACLYEAPCMAVDVLAAVRYLRRAGARNIAVIGGSAGGGAAAQASIDAADGEIDRLILLAPMPIDAPEKMKGRTMFAVARNDPDFNGKPRLPGIRDQYERAPAPSVLHILAGAAHGQKIFDDPAEGPRLLAQVIAFLRKR
jgi:dienelactone hydrolase/molybdopterin converting factor small subunit